jgi:hypothetical protein
MTPGYRFVLASAALLLGTALGVVVPAPQAVADDAIDISIFYTSLDPHGEWVRTQNYGWAWAPENVEYRWRPYTVGHWSWVEPYGWTWVSNEPWGWATYHYGRWTYIDDYGWVWVPGSVWAPAWVAFRYGNPWVGWAPLPPGSNWRYDQGYYDGMNVQIDIGAWAWSFVGLRYFGAQDMSARLYTSAYNPYFVQRTDWATRYAPIDGGLANQSIDIAAVEQARGSPIPRRRLREVSAPDTGGTRVEGDSVVLYRPRIVPKAPAIEPRRRPVAGPATKADLDAWTEQRKAALEAHLEAQRKALEQQDVAPPPSVQSKPGMGPDDAAKRREAAAKALEEERRRMEMLIERQRLRREQQLKEQQKAPPTGMGDDHPGMGDGRGGMGGGQGMK